MSNQQNPHDFFLAFRKNLPKIKKEIIADVVAVETKNFTRKNFREGGFTDTSFTPWKKREIDDAVGESRALLVKSSTMKGHAARPVTQAKGVEFGFPLKYEKVHNYGLQAGRGKGFTMPKREYIGESDYLNKAIEKKARKVLDKYLK
jgi:phage gpG-like protein